VKGNDLIGDSGWRDEVMMHDEWRWQLVGSGAGQWWWQRVQRVRVERIVRDDE